MQLQRQKSITTSQQGKKSNFDRIIEKSSNIAKEDANDSLEIFKWKNSYQSISKASGSSLKKDQIPEKFNFKADNQPLEKVLNSRKSSLFQKNTSTHLPNITTDSRTSKQNFSQAVSLSHNRLSFKVYLEPEIEERKKKELRSNLLKNMDALRQSENESLKFKYEAAESTKGSSKKETIKSKFQLNELLLRSKSFENVKSSIMANQSKLLLARNSEKKSRMPYRLLEHEYSKGKEILEYIKAKKGVL